MVGETMCLLESLDPLQAGQVEIWQHHGEMWQPHGKPTENPPKPAPQAAVLKVSTVFTSPFSLQDLASSSCSRLECHMKVTSKFATR